MYSDVVETVTFETETWLKFRDETETSKFVHFAEFFQKNVVITLTMGVHGGDKRAFLPLRLKLNTKIL